MRRVLGPARAQRILTLQLATLFRQKSGAAEGGRMALPTEEMAANFALKRSIETVNIE